MPSSVEQYAFTEQYSNPDLCFTEARKLAPKDPDILGRYARYLRRIGRYQDALDALGQSRQESVDWLWYDTRANVYKSMFFDKDKGRYPDSIRYLQLAKADFQKASQLEPSPQQETRIGSCLHKLGEVKEAMGIFQGVLNYLNGRKFVRIHQDMGHCLRRDHYRQAAESFKRAIECDSGCDANGLGTKNNWDQLMQLLLKMCKAQPYSKHLVEEARFWLEEGNAKYGRDAERVREKLCHHHGVEILKVCKSLAAIKGQLQCDTASEYLPYLLDANCPPRRRREITQLLQDLQTHTSPPSVAPSILPSFGLPQNRKSKRFDCFIWFQTKEGRDAEWVYYSLLQKVEVCQGYKCCVPGRDRDVASVRSTMELPGHLKNSACVIVVVTPTFCKDEIRQEVLKTLIEDDVHTVLPVSLDDYYLPTPLRNPKVIPHYSWELLFKAIAKACEAD